MTFKDRQSNAMTFQALKMKFSNSITFQVFHDLYEPLREDLPEDLGRVQIYTLLSFRSALEKKKATF